MTSATHEIHELEERITQAERVLDPKFFDEILDDGCSFVAPDGTVYGKRQVIEAHEPAGATKFSRYETSDLQVRDFGNAALVTLKVALSAGGSDVELFFTRFWLSREGRWRIVGGSALQLSHSH